jgi:hypothetical protein
MDTTTLMMVMAMSGGRSMNKMLPLLLLMGGNSGTSLSTLLTPQNMLIPMMTKNPVMQLALGGTAAMLAGTLLGGLMTRPRRRKKQPKVIIYRNGRRYRRY